MSSISGFIQREIKQKKPFTSLETEALVGIVIVADVLRRACASVVEQGGVTSHQQYNVLRILRGAGAKGLPVREIAARLVEKAPGITRFIDQLESRGLITRRRSTSDRRQVFCRITSSGLKLLRRLDKPVEEWEKKSMSMLTRGKLKQLLICLGKIHSFHRKAKG